MNYQKFYIDKQYLCSVNVVTKFPNGGSSMGTKDHDNFTVLREMLSANGFIKIERGWWNGDRVLKPFYLNNLLFKPSQKFPCAGAMGHLFRLERNQA